MSPFTERHSSQFCECFPVPALCCHGQRWRNGLSMEELHRHGQAGLLPCLTCHLAPSTLFISGIHTLQVQSKRKKKGGGGAGGR